MSPYDQMIERCLNSLELGMSGWPSNLPPEQHQPTRDAIVAWRNGDRSPELILFLAATVSIAPTNVTKAQLVAGFNDMGMRINGSF